MEWINCPVCNTPNKIENPDSFLLNRVNYKCSFCLFEEFESSESINTAIEALKEKLQEVKEEMLSNNFNARLRRLKSFCEKGIESKNPVFRKELKRVICWYTKVFVKGTEV